MPVDLSKWFPATKQGDGKTWFMYCVLCQAKYKVEVLRKDKTLWPHTQTCAFHEHYNNREPFWRPGLPRCMGTHQTLEEAMACDVFRGYTASTDMQIWTRVDD